MAEYEIEELEQGLPFGTNQRHEIKLKEHTLQIRIPVTEKKANLWDDRYILVEERSEGKFQQVRSMKDDLIPGDQYVDLIYFDLKPNCVYSLIIDPGDDDPYYFFKDMQYGELFE